MEKIINAIIEYSQKLKDANLIGDKDYILYRVDGNKACLAEGNFRALTAEQVRVIDYTKEDLLPAKILMAKKDVNVVMSVAPEKVMVAAKARKDVPAVLDDMAQIVGVKAKVVSYDEGKILKEFKKANSILIADGGAITTGRTLNEAFTCAMVLEKSATVIVGASVVGKYRKINFFEAKLMRLVYKMKYSKKNQENLLSEEKTNG
ncbi:hypothetical protein EOM82_04935 [bacterium]|nr:hypothetical protein [bacterium]